LTSLTAFGIIFSKDDREIAFTIRALAARKIVLKRRQSMEALNVYLVSYEDYGPCGTIVKKYVTVAHDEDEAKRLTSAKAVYAYDWLVEEVDVTTPNSIKVYTYSD
jgi:hypothetical protein